MNGNANRLPEPAGSLIDRSQTVTFRFEGKPYTGFVGDTIASALMANNRWIISRSFKYHRPRGTLTMAAQDSNTLVQLPHEPNVFADRHEVTDGLQVKGQNYIGSLDHDRYAFLDKLSRFMPVGFYYRTFMGPGKNAFLKVWEPLIRKLGGLGRISLDAPHEFYDKAYRFFDVLVVGGGPAGLAAAAAAADWGATVFLVDENRQLGGSLTYARGAPNEFERAQRLSDLVRAIANRPAITVMTEAICNAWHSDNWMPVIKGNRLFKVRAREVVIAAGSFEQPVVNRNNDLPGIMLGSAAQRLIRHFAVRPGKRAVVLTCNAQGYGVALDLKEAGVEIVAIVDPRPDGGAGPFADKIKSAGFKILMGHGLREAEGTKGNRHVRRVFAAPLIDGNTAYSDRGSWFRCDHVSVCGGYMPAYQLPVQSGAKLHYSDDTALFSISGLPPHVHLAGSVNGVFDQAAVEDDGRRAGRDAARSLGLPVKGSMAPEVGSTGESVNFPWPLKPHSKGKDFIDFDEDLQINDLENAVAEGYSELELVKRFSTVGMGPSQGRHSALATARIVAGQTGRRVADVGVTTARPPFTAEKLGVLAGVHRIHYRHTPMHHRHLEMGAQMTPVGAWWRPAYYGAPADKDRIITEEVRAVREGVGMLDVSTLGGLEIRGPDAAEFLNRVYTIRCDNQPIGRIRYALLVNEMGSLMDDGVVLRISDDHYYVTSTTGAVGNVYQLMLWMNAQWNLSVDMANVTAVFSGLNITGPKAQKFLDGLSDDIDFSHEEFPYLQGRLGTIAGIPARVLRIGFSGEVSYEVHVPHAYGESLWDRLIEAGQPIGLRPYGLEASRILRLEKGHIIIGQDTDSMTTTDEVAMNWAVSKKKDFFLGKRSMEQRRKTPPTRRLIGFEIAGPSLDIAESCMVMRGGKPVGHVTSTCYSPTLGKRIGLAYSAPDDEVGQTITLRSRKGMNVTAQVVSPHFYDPDNKRQEN